jgi:hypothetical protein
VSSGNGDWGWFEFEFEFLVYGLMNYMCFSWTSLVVMVVVGTFSYAKLCVCLLLSGCVWTLVALSYAVSMWIAPLNK